MLRVSEGTDNQLDDQETKRNLRLLTFEGGAYSLMVGVGETYLAALVIAIGLGDYLAGLITTVPVLGGACLQLLSVWGVRRLNSNRHWVVFAAASQALSAALIAVLVFTGAASTWSLFTVATLYWFGGLAAGPAWNAWVDHLVPSPRRATFFGGRAKTCQVFVLIGILLGGGLLQSSSTVLVFALIFGLAAVCRCVSAITISLGTELPAWRPSAQRSIGITSRTRILGSESKRFLGYLLCMQAAVYISAPFFTPYMLNHLGLGYLEYTWLISLGFVGKIVAMPWAGRMASEYGANRMLLFGGIGIVPLASAWLISDSLVFLSFVQIIGGVLWAFYELATMLLFFEKIPQQQRVAALSIYNLGNASAMVVGSLIGGLLLQFLNNTLTAYLTVFLCSSLARCVATIWIPRTSESLPSPAKIPAIRLIAVRPLAGGWLRPILSNPIPGPVDQEIARPSVAERLESLDKFDASRA